MPPDEPLHLLPMEPRQLDDLIAAAHRHTHFYSRCLDRCQRLGMTRDNPLCVALKKAQAGLLASCAEMERIRRCARDAHRRGIDRPVIPGAPRHVGQTGHFGAVPVYEVEREAAAAPEPAGWPWPD